MRKISCKLLWDFSEGWYFAFGFDILAPIKLFFPYMDRWMFEGMTGLKGERIDD